MYTELDQLVLYFYITVIQTKLDQLVFKIWLETLNKAMTTSPRDCNAAISYIGW